MALAADARDVIEPAPFLHETRDIAPHETTPEGHDLDISVHDTPSFFGLPDLCPANTREPYPIQETTLC